MKKLSKRRHGATTYVEEPLILPEAWFVSLWGISLVLVYRFIRRHHFIMENPQSSQSPVYIYSLISGSDFILILEISFLASICSGFVVER